MVGSLRLAHPKRPGSRYEILGPNGINGEIAHRGLAVSFEESIAHSHSSACRAGWASRAKPSTDASCAFLSRSDSENTPEAKTRAFSESKRGCFICFRVRKRHCR